MDGRQSYRRALRASLFSLGIAAGVPAHSAVLLSEVFYDASGGDAGQVFVELYGPAGLDLAGYELRGINGSGGDTYKTVALSGLIPADGVFVVADDDGGSTAVPEADLLADVDLQNGPDSIELWDGGMVIDALGYGDFTSAVFAGQGDPAPDVSAGQSLARVSVTGSNLADFMVLDTPTPGSSAISAVPVPAAVYLMGSGLALLSTRLRRRT